jgi:uncharacterized protein with von Willebrand factor type A (vWA) domain
MRLFMSFLFELRQVMDEDLRGFVFVSQVHEITEILKEKKYEKMLERIHQEGDIDFRGYSDYGVAFQKFDAMAGDSLGRETVLMILGDARSNRRAPRVDLVRKWAKKAKKVFWFNPDLPYKWNQGDSVVAGYARVVRHIYDVSTPAKLVGAIESIVL